MVESHWESTHPKIPWRKNHPLDRDSSTGGYEGRHVIFNWTCFQSKSASRVAAASSRGGCRPWFGQMSDANGSTASVWLTLTPDPAYTTWRCGKQATSRRIRGWSAGLPAMDLIRFPTFPLLRSIRPRGLHLSFAVEEWSAVELYFIWYIHVIYACILTVCFFFFFSWRVNFIKDNNFWGRRRFSERWEKIKRS